ncbi:MAG: histidine ammonia-lyase [Candidatus Aminicenantia bacterium]
MSVEIDGEHLTFDDFERVCKGKERVSLSLEARERIRRCRKVLEELIKEGRVIYGINTGFGALANVKIDYSELKKLQLNLIRSHSGGVGEPLSEEIARGIILLRTNVLARGYSGVREEIVDLLISLLNTEITPLIPSQGSVGASGDLAPLSHLALVLIGEGEVYYKGDLLPSSKAFEKANLKPISLEPREGLALINGTQVMTSIGVNSLILAGNVLKAGDVASAMTLEVMRGSKDPFDERIHLLRPYNGQIESAKRIREYIEGSEILELREKERVQDCYSLRCIPQVHGAINETLTFVRGILEKEINSVTDNPIIFPEEREVISGGNFHGEPVALAMDFLSIAMTELGNISERRIDRIVNPSLNLGLPPFLTKSPGLNSGLMMAQIVSASLAAENRALSFPASVENIPTTGGQEDHVSMGTISALKALKIVNNTKMIVGYELLCAAQALEFFKPHKNSPFIEKVLKKIREKVPYIEEDSRLDVYLKEILKIMDNWGQVFNF